MPGILVVKSATTLIFLLVVGFAIAATHYLSQRRKKLESVALVSQFLSKWQLIGINNNQSENSINSNNTSQSAKDNISNETVYVLFQDLLELSKIWKQLSQLIQTQLLPIIHGLTITLIVQHPEVHDIISNNAIINQCLQKFKEQSNNLTSSRMLPSTIASPAKSEQQPEISEQTRNCCSEINTAQTHNVSEGYFVAKIQNSLENKSISIIDVYVLQALIILLSVFHLNDSAEFVCFEAPSLILPHLHILLQDALLQKIDQASEQAQLSVVQKIFATEDKMAVGDNDTLRRIFSLPSLSLEQKRLVVLNHILSLPDERQEHLIKQTSAYFSNCNLDHGDFMLRLKRLNDIRTQQQQEQS